MAAQRTARGLLGELEYEVMQALWSEQPLAVPDVLHRLNGRRRRSSALAYTTVMTVLSRLYDKGLLDRAKVGRGYAYTAVFDEGELVRHLGRQEVDGLVQRYGPVALAQFAAALRDADPALLEDIEALAGEDDGRA